MKTPLSIAEGVGPRFRLHRVNRGPLHPVFPVLGLRAVDVSGGHRNYKKIPSGSSFRGAGHRRFHHGCHSRYSARDVDPLNRIPDDGSEAPVRFPNATEEELGLLHGILKNAPASGDTSMNESYLKTPRTTPPIGPRPPAHPGLQHIFRSTRKTLEYLAQASPPRTYRRGRGPLPNRISELSHNTFSELLRSLDPMTVASNDMDPTVDVRISPGMTQYTELSHLVDNFGVRRVYTWLLGKVVAAAQYRVEAGFGLLQSDYKILLRCAGAASDLHMAKRIWHLWESSGLVMLRDGDSYGEFIRARFLTQPLYAQYDNARFRVSPVQLHKQKIWLEPRQLRKLRGLRYRILARQGHRFGQNRYSPDKAEALARVLRKTKPIRKVFLKVLNDGVMCDEKLLCSAMVAFARSGSLKFIGEEILWKFYKIRVQPDRETGEITVSGAGASHSSDSPLYPTVQLLDAVVESFCCNAEIAAAFKLLDHISRRYAIPIPDQTWCRLLEWTYVLSTAPASTEWKIAALPDKIVRPAMVQTVWDTMVSEPYNIRPGFGERIVLIKSLIDQSRLKAAVQKMLELQPAYVDAARDLEDAIYEHACTARLGVDTARSLRRWRQASARKQTMWYAIEECCWKLLKQVRSNRIDDIMTVRLVPQLVDAFRPHFARCLRYRIATGVVELRNPNPVAMRVAEGRVVDQPALVTRDVVGPYVEIGADAGEGHSGNEEASSRPAAHSDLDVPPREARRQRMLFGRSVPSRLLSSILRRDEPSKKQLLREFA